MKPAPNSTSVLWRFYRLWCLHLGYAIIAGMSQVSGMAGQDSGRLSLSVHRPGRLLHRLHLSSYLLALLLLSLFAWAPLLYPGYIQVHSGFLPVLNLADLAAAPDRLHRLPRVGVAHDLLRGEGPLAYWLALPFRLLLGDVDAVKAIFGLSIMAGGLGTYVLVRRTAAGTLRRPARAAILKTAFHARKDTTADEKRAAADDQAPFFWAGESDAPTRAAVLAGVVYMLWPPLLATIYVRGALAEALFMGLWPWVLWIGAGPKWCEEEEEGERIEERGEGSGSRREAVAFGGFVLAGAVVVALMFLAQPGLALWAVPVLLAWAAWTGRDWRSRLWVVAGVVMGTLLGSGLLWLLYGGVGLGGGQAPNFADHAVYLYQLFSADWGFGVSTPDWKNELPLQLGLATTGLAMLAVVLSVGRAKSASQRKDESANGDHPPPAIRHPLRFAVLAAAILILLTTTIARPLWTWLPFLARPLSYPWQLYALVGPLLALLAGSVVLLERRLARLPVWAGLVALTVLSSYSYLAPRFTQVQPDPTIATIFGDRQIALLTAKVSLEPAARSRPAEEQPASAPSEARSLEATQAVTVTISWQALRPLDFDYNVFVHAVDDNGQIITQWDGQPRRAGEPYPMTSWSVGEVVIDSYRLELTEDGLARLRRVNLGLYNWQTGERLPVNGDNQVTLEVGP